MNRRPLCPGNAHRPRLYLLSPLLTVVQQSQPSEQSPAQLRANCPASSVRGQKACAQTERPGAPTVTLPANGRRWAQVSRQIRVSGLGLLRHLST